MLRTIHSHQTEFTLFGVKLLLLQWNRIDRIVSAAKGLIGGKMHGSTTGIEHGPQERQWCRQHLFFCDRLIRHLTLAPSLDCFLVSLLQMSDSASARRGWVLTSLFA